MSQETFEQDEAYAQLAVTASMFLDLAIKVLRGELVLKGEADAQDSSGRPIGSCQFEFSVEER